MAVVACNSNSLIGLCIEMGIALLLVMNGFLQFSLMASYSIENELCMTENEMFVLRFVAAGFDGHWNPKAKSPEEVEG